MGEHIKIMVLKNKFLNFLNWLKSKNGFFEKIIGLSIGLYFVSICLIYFLSIQAFFPLPSTVVLIIKGANFAFFALLFLFYFVSTKTPFNKRILLLLLMIFVVSFFAILLNPSSREITSIARISINNELYSGWTYNVIQQTIDLTFGERVTALLTLITFVFSVFMFICIFPIAFKRRKNKEIALMIVSIAIAVFVNYSIIFERDAIIKIIKNGFNSTKGIKSIFDNKNTFGLICFFGFLSSANLLCHKKMIPVAIITMIFSAFGVVITVCKTAIMSVLLFVILFAVLFTIFVFKKKKRVWIIISTVAWGGLALTLLLIFALPQLNSVSNSISQIFIDYGSTTLASRFEAWRTVFQTANGYNILTGYGDDICMKYFIASTEAIRFWHITPYFSAHNSFLELYLAGGLFRLILYIFLVYVICKSFKWTQGFSRCILISSFVSFLGCSLFETVILCDHTTLAFVPSILFVSTPLSLKKTTEEVEPKETFKSILFDNLSIKNFYKKNIFSIIVMSITIFCAILSGYFIYYKNYGLFSFLLLITIAGLVVMLSKPNKNKNKNVFVFNYGSSILIASLVLFIIFVFDKNTSFLTGIPYSFQENKYKDIVSVHYLGGFYPFLITFVTTAILYFGTIISPRQRKNDIEYYYEIKI